MSAAVARLPTVAEMSTQRVPPHSHEAEMLCVGHCMRGAVDEIAELLRPEHFTDPGLRRIYEACLAIAGQGKRVDPVSVGTATQDDVEVGRLGGPGFVAQLAGAAFGAPWARQHAGVVLDAWSRRELILAGEEAIAAAHVPPIDPTTGMPLPGEAIAAALDARIVELTGGTDRNEPRTYRDALDGAIARVDRAFNAGTHITGVPTGLTDLDEKTGGLHAPDFIVVAARPRMGKTALLLGIAKSAALKGWPVAFFSVEMNAEELAARDLAAETGISSDRQRRGDVKTQDFNALVQASTRLADLPIHIDDSPAASVARLRARARRLQRRHGLGLIVIDYLQLMVAADRAENRTQEVSKITRDLKVMAKDLGVPVVAASQLNRDLEKRDDKRPTLADLRDSGSIEQDADSVIFLYRHEVYLPKKPPERRSGENKDRYAERLADWGAERDKHRGLAEAIIAKNRHGPETIVELYFDGERTQFRDLARGYEL